MFFLDGFDGDAGRGQVFGKLSVVDSDVNELTQAMRVGFSYYSVRKSRSPSCSLCL